MAKRKTERGLTEFTLRHDLDDLRWVKHIEACPEIGNAFKPVLAAKRDAVEKILYAKQTRKHRAEQAAKEFGGGNAFEVSFKAQASEYRKQVKEIIKTPYASRPLSKSIEAIDSRLKFHGTNVGAILKLGEHSPIDDAIRTHVRGLGVDAGTFINAAIEAKDWTTVSAVLRGPAYLSGVSNEVLEKWRDQAMGAIDPTWADESRALKAFKADLESVGRKIDQQLGEEVADAIDADNAQLSLDERMGREDAQAPQSLSALFSGLPGVKVGGQ